MGGTPPNAPPPHFNVYQTQTAQPGPAPFLNVQWRPKEPATFSGKLSEDVVQWFRIVKDYLEFMGGTPAMQVSYVVTLLTGAARDHWDNILNQQGGIRPHSVTALETLMVERFGHASRHTENLHKILTMRQGKRSVREFARDFENACGKLTSYDDSWAQQIFTWGLNRDLAVQVSMAEPQSLAEAVQKAEQVDMAVRYATMNQGQQKGSTGQGNNPSRNAGNWRRGAGGSSGRFRGGYRTGGGRFGVTRGRTSGGRIYRPQQQYQQRQQQNTVRCYNCNRFGHYSSDCPQLQRQGQRGGFRGGSQRRGGRGRNNNQRMAAFYVDTTQDTEMADATVHMQPNAAPGQNQGN